MISIFFCERGSAAKRWMMTAGSCTTQPIQKKQGPLQTQRSFLSASFLFQTDQPVREKLKILGKKFKKSGMIARVSQTSLQDTTMRLANYIHTESQAHSCYRL
jgi:hypothetical protein